MVRLPWKEVVYPKFIHDPSEELGLAPTHQDLCVSGRLPSEGGSSLGGGWGGSSSGELDSWSWDDEEENEGSACDGSRRRVPALPSRRRCSEDGLLRPGDGDYVELLEPRLEPRLGPDGGVDTKQRYLEMHGICKTRTLPLCRRGRAIKLRKGKAWGHAKAEGSGSLPSKRSPGTSNDDVSLPSQPQGRVTTVTSTSSAAASPPRGRQCYSSTGHHSDGGDKTLRSSERSEGLFYVSRLKERRPGVGKERDSGGLTLPGTWRSQESESSEGPGASDLHSRLSGVFGEGQSDPGFHSDSVFEDKPLSGDSDATTPTSDAAERPFRGRLEDGGAADGIGAHDENEPSEDVAPEQDGEKSEDKVCLRGKEVKNAGFRAPRFLFFSFHSKLILNSNTPNIFSRIFLDFKNLMMKTSVFYFCVCTHQLRNTAVKSRFCETSDPLSMSATWTVDIMDSSSSYNYRLFSTFNATSAL